MQVWYRQKVNTWIGIVFIATLAFGAGLIILSVSANVDSFLTNLATADATF